MHQLVENLRAFNRKERFFVVGWALDNPLFSLGEKFRRELMVDIDVSIPADAFCAMDFHLDWLTGCLWLAKGVQPTYSMLETGKVNEKNDDIDLLIAFDDAEVTRLLMIEAKGVTGWHNSQLRAKARRLTQIFGDGEAGDLWPGVAPTFVLASPKKSQQIDVSEWPLWMKAGDEPRHWLQLHLPDGLRKIVRCDEDGKRNAHGEFWKVV